MNGIVNTPGVTGWELEGVKSSLKGHIDDQNNPHGVTKAQVGLEQVDNTADADKPISTAQQTAFDQKADATAFASHVDDITRHITAAERDKWNATADSTAVASHINDTVVHITAAEREKWNATADSTTVASHISDAVAHITAVEREEWNAKQDALVFDAKPTADSQNPVTSGGIKAALDKKSPLSHGLHVEFPSSMPEMNGSASMGSASTCARSDHIHPTDTSRAAVSHRHSISDITSGTLTSDRLPVVPLTKGGTNATTAAAALSNLGISIQASPPSYLLSGAVALVYV